MATTQQEAYLTEKEIDELVKEWRPEPLTPDADVSPVLRAGPSPAIIPSLPSALVPI